MLRFVRSRNGHFVVERDHAAMQRLVDFVTANLPGLNPARLQVDAAQMRANLDVTHGTIVSEAVMMGLGPYLGRQRAHDLVYDICREVTIKRTPLIDLLARNPEISKHLSRAELERMVDPAHYLGLAGEMVDRVLAMEQQAKA